MILINLQKAFDTIDHEILFQKLKAVRFSEGTLQWFRYYLSERIFLVNTESKLSDFGKIYCGVPQGSILGPLLFLIFVNDMPQAAVFARKNCVYCNSHVRQNLHVQCSVNFEFGTYDVIKCIFIFFNLNKVTYHVVNYTCLLFWKCSFAYY